MVITKHIIVREKPEIDLEQYMLELKKAGVNTMDIESHLDGIISSNVSMPLREVL